MLVVLLVSGGSLLTDVELVAPEHVDRLCRGLFPEIRSAFRKTLGYRVLRPCDLSRRTI